MNRDGMVGAVCPDPALAEISAATTRRKKPGVGNWQAQCNELGR
jgi:hypothetical protein